MIIQIKDYSWIYIYKYYKCILQIIYRAVGYYTHGTEYYDKLEDNIRRMAEKCSRLHGFLTMHSLGGGTGSGLGTAVLKLLADNYPTVDRYLYNKNISHSFKIFIHILLKITVLIFINFILCYCYCYRLVSCVYPIVMQDVVTAPYNVLLATRELIDYATCVFPIENEALVDICNAQLRKKENIDQINYNISCKPFQDMNSIIANILLHLTR